MISAKTIRQLAREWDSGRKWCNANRDIIRYVFRMSPRRDRKINLQFFSDCIGLAYDEVWRIGNLTRYRDDLKRKKYGQETRTHKSEGVVIIPETDAWSYQGGKKTKGGGRVSIQAGQFYGA